VLDQVSLVHDIEYLKPNNEIQADIRFIKNIIKKKGVSGIPLALSTGLIFGVKNALGIKLSEQQGNVKDYEYYKRLAIKNNLAKESDFN
jgi:hypothetical protein